MRAETVLILSVLSFSLISCAVKDVREYPKSRTPVTNVEPEYVSDELLVLFRQGTAESRISAINESLDVQVVRAMLPGRSYLIKVPKCKSLEEVLQAYFAYPEVEAVDLNYKARIL
jgi:hypothetical protein